VKSRKVGEVRSVEFRVCEKDCPGEVSFAEVWLAVESHGGPELFEEIAGQNGLADAQRRTRAERQEKLVELVRWQVCQAAVEAGDRLGGAGLAVLSLTADW
jgi:hypothetical protein